ncbi:unnamed protein product [Prorocentrum cordatum]|uniref:Uncharacterized protein n=1 Tax=Prorocentrum cordatum TaxID=2364126 RepID=A0ABN9SZV7_9DINO|nr:unnamed protein product [Polarella glacialis]
MTSDGAAAPLIAFAVVSLMMFDAGVLSCVAVSAATYFFSSSLPAPPVPAVPRRQGARSTNKVRNRRMRAYKLGFIPHPPDRRTRGQQSATDSRGFLDRTREGDVKTKAPRHTYGPNDDDGDMGSNPIEHLLSATSESA